MKEIQEIASDAHQGQILSRGFKVHFSGYSTSLIPHDATSDRLKAEMPVMGKISVSRQSSGMLGGYSWRITFESVVGNVDDLQATNLLNGLGASLRLETIVHGNSIGGNFSLSFLGSITRPIPHYISAADLQNLLTDDIPQLEKAHVVRTDPTNMIIVMMDFIRMDHMKQGDTYGL